MDIHKRIEQIRKQKGWSRSKLAKEAGLAETTVYDWYNENNFTPSRRAIEDVCEAFEMTLSEFYTDIEVDQLTQEQLLLLELFNQLQENRRAVVIDIIKCLIDKP